MAKAHSELLSATKGGDAGWYGKADLADSISKAISPLKPGELSPLVRAGDYFYLFLLAEQQGGEEPTVASAQDQIINILRQKKFSETYSTFITQLKAENYIRINPRFL